MPLSGGVKAGAIFLTAAAQFVLGIVIAEALYPGYSVSANYVSDLGVGPSSSLFNASVFLLGALILSGVLSLRKSQSFKTVNTFLLLMALGTMGVGLFSKDNTLVHGAVSSFAFLFSALSAIASVKALSMPLSVISAILGFMTLGALALFSIGMVVSGSLTSTEAIDSEYYLGLGPGGMERMIVYPGLIWLAAFGGHLLKEETVGAGTSSVAQGGASRAWIPIPESRPGPSPVSDGPVSRGSMENRTRKTSRSVFSPGIF